MSTNHLVVAFAFLIIHQGFTKSVKGWAKSPQWGVGMGNFGGEFLKQVVRIWQGVILTILIFLKAKNKVAKYWTFKIRMTCVDK